MTAGRPTLTDLEAHYDRLERSFPTVDSPEYARLVVPTGNLSAPVHRWFHLKEAFSHQLLERLLKDAELHQRRGVRVLDPYSGVGTTAVSVGDLTLDAQLKDPTVYGIEANGFLHLVASAKLESLQRPVSTFPRFAAKVATRALGSTDLPALPLLTTFTRDEFFDRADVDQLMRLKCAIDQEEVAGADPLELALARVCLGSIVEAVSNLRRDGRALRYTEKRMRPATLEAFTSKAAQMSADLPTRGARVHGRIMRGDGRALEGIDNRHRPFDLILFSPPYPNNIDYTEVYKLENWLLGFISDRASFAEQRLRTVYSHPSLLRAEPLPSVRLTERENAAVAAIVEPILAPVPPDRYAEGRRRMVNGYALDMYLTLRKAATRLAPDGRIVYVVGNSVHGVPPGQMIIAADLMIAQLAAQAGLSVQRIAVARHLKRRNVTSRYLRESVVFLAHSG